MAVPATGFSQQNVENEIPGVQGNLTALFAAAKTAGFNAGYVGSKDRLSNFGLYAHTVVSLYQTAGTFTWVCPAGVTLVKVETYGAGGGGKGISATTGYGGGGGSGGYSTTSNQAVTPGLSYTIIVGAGGAGSSGNGGNGTASVFKYSTTIYSQANGGFGATSTTGGTAANTSGAVGTTTRAGGTGGNAGGSASGGGGGGAGTSNPGGNASLTTPGSAGGGYAGAGGSGIGGNNGGGQGNQAGGAGAGAARLNSGTSNGGKGADGTVVLTY